MTANLWRAPRARHRCAGFVLALITITALVLPSVAVAASAPRIVSVDVSGNVHVPADRILAVVKARPGDPYNPNVVADDLKSIFALGYFADQVPPLIRQRPDGIAITYRVIENPVITRITFTGNTHVPNDSLLALMDTSVGQVLNTNTFHQDVLKINAYYDKQGYGGQVPTHVKDLNIDPATGVLALTIQEALTIRHVLIVGDPLLPPPIILPVLATQPGGQFSNEMSDKDYEAIKKLYDKYDLILGDFSAGIDPSSIDLKAGTADVREDIRVAKIAAVEITGNTRTKDEVVRRELRMRPGMYLTNAGLRRDYERLNATGFFSKVDPQIKPGPDPKNPALLTVDWAITEQRTGTASIGAGYAGGLTGQGLYGTLSFSNSNINGTGNGGTVQVERGSRNYVTSLSVSIPYVGHTKTSQKYSLGATIFGNGQTNYYPIYATTTGVFATPPPGGTASSIPVTLFPNQNSVAIGGVIATSVAKSSGASVQVGRRLTDYTRAQVGIGVTRVVNQVTVPQPYYFQNGTPSVLVGPTPSPFSNGTANGSFGITAPSIANINTGAPYALNTVGLGISTDTRDDIFNPHRGHTGSLNETVSAPGIGSNFNFTTTTFDAANFFPFRGNSTLGIHGQANISTGAIPPSSLFTFSDQQLRGYTNVFYGTDTLLGQIELRKPILSGGKLVLAAFADEGAWRIRGAQPLLDPYTNRIIGYPGNWSARGDIGLGIRFDLPQLNLRTIRIDFARGANGTHTSFGIGQSF